MRWWGWLLVILGGLFALLIAAARYWRARVRRDFVQFLARKWPEFEVVEFSDRLMKFRHPDAGEGTLNPKVLYDACLDSKARTAVEREPVFEHFLGLLRDAEAGAQTLDIGRDRDRIMPRLATSELFAQLKEAVPNLPIGETGLFMVTVLDLDESVVYLTDAHLAELALTPSALFELALNNLRAKMPMEKIVRGAIDKPALVSVKTMDSYEAARLMLVPEHLRDGEALIAAVPDRDTLVLLAEPPGADFAALKPLLTPGSDHHLLDRLLRVTSQGIETVG